MPISPSVLRLNLERRIVPAVMSGNFFFQWGQLQRKLSGLDEGGRPAPRAPAWSPNADVFESPGGLLIRIELAGVSPNDVEIQTDDQTLAVRGSRRDPQSKETADGYRLRQMEIDFGCFERIFPLPFAVDGEHARATFKEGILIIHVPRAPTPHTTRIRIEVGG